jgi:hypothetical protein
MKNKILMVPLIAAILVFAAVGSGHALSPYVPNYFSYDPEWKGDLPKFGGYVNAYLTYSHQYDGQYNDLDAGKAAFTLDRAELYLQHRATDWADGYVEVSITAVGETDISLDEAWLRVVIPWGNGLTLLGGAYDVPIGIGANENIDIWNWQFKMVNTLVAPWAITGILAEYEVGFANINFWIGDDWGYSEAIGRFENSGRENTDTEMLYGGRIGFAPNEIFDWGISLVWANRDPTSYYSDLAGEDVSVPWQSQFMVDMDFEWLDLPSFLGCANLELWWLQITDFPTFDIEDSGEFEDSQAYGAVVQFNFATPMESLSVSLGYEYIWEENGVVFGVNPNTEGMMGLEPPGMEPIGAPVSAQTRQSVEVTPIWAIGDHVIVTLSWRSDWSTKDVFTNGDGNPTDFAWLTAWEWYYYF